MKRRSDAFLNIRHVLAAAVFSMSAHAQENVVVPQVQYDQIELDQIEMLNPVEPRGILDPYDPIYTPVPTASPAFLREFASFSTHLAEGDSAGAAATLEGMSALNPYEVTWLNYAHAQFEAKQGNPVQQMFEASESMDGLMLLPVELETAARRVLLQLQIRHNRLHEALDTHALMEANDDADGFAGFQPAIQQIRELADNEVSYPVAAELDDTGTWQLALHKRQFYIDEVAGTVTEAAVECEEKSQSLALEPLLGYTLPLELGACTLTFTGAPGTTFTLVQYRD